jgi:hypothetical protein
MKFNKRWVPFFLILLLSAGVRLITAWVSLGFDHPNEIYRLLEPLAELSGYTAHSPWEWNENLLSRLPVFAHLRILHFADLLGISGAIAQARLLHILYGLLSLSQVYCAWRLVKQATKSEKTAGVAALLVGLWPDLVYHSVRLMDYSLEASLLAIAVLLVFGEFEREKKQSHYLSGLGGVILGFLFFVRFQTGLHLLSFSLILLYDYFSYSPSSQKRSETLTRLLTLAFSYGLTVGALGLLEARGLSDFLLPFRNYFHFNWTLNGAEAQYGAMPWHRYLTEIAKFFGIFPIFVFLGLAIRGIHGRKILLLTLLPLLVHSLISHKEGRFVWGCLFLLIPAALCEWNSKMRVFFQGPFWLRWNPACVALVLFLSLSLGLVISIHRFEKRFLLRADWVRSFAKAGEVIQRQSPKQTQTIVVTADPIHSPGAFFLRWSGPVVYGNFATASLSKPEHFYLLENTDLKPPGRLIWTNSLWSVFFNPL